MPIKGKAKADKKDFVRDLFVGFAKVGVSALNPSRAEVAKITGRDIEGNDREEILYLDKDSEGNTRLSLKFWLNDEDNDKYFVQSIMITDIDRVSKDKMKVQIINSTCQTTWVPLELDKNGEPTSKVDEKLIPEWFLQFTNSDKEVIGTKKWRKAVKGEEELATLLHAWVAIDWKDTEADVLLDTKKLFKENLKELRDIVGNTEYTKKFVALVGVETNEDDPAKKYQKVFSKSYLPSGFMTYINAGNKMPSDYTKRVWKKFTDDSSGQYGFSCFHKLKPLELYVPGEDPVASNSGKPTVSAPADNEY